MKFFVTFLILALGVVAQARIDLATTQVWPAGAAPTGVNNQEQKDVATMIPTNIPATGDMNIIMHSIADYNFQEKFKGEWNFPSKTRTVADQKLTLKYAAFQNVAKFEYIGRFHFNINYSVLTPQADFTLSEPVWRNKNLTVSHSITGKESSNTVGLGWSF